MKNTIAILLFISLAGTTDAQKKILGVATGYSVFNSKSVSIYYETHIKNSNYLGVFAEGFFYSDDKQPLGLRTDETHYYAGLYYKPLLSSSRNFSHHAVLGGAVGTHHKKLLYYPLVGLEQDFYVAPGTVLFTGEELKYLFPLSRKWQPFLKVGMKLIL